MSSAGLYEIPVDGVDRFSVDWSDWLDDLPTGQALNSVVSAFDGANGGLTVDYEAVAGNVYTAQINAAGGSAVPGFVYLKLTATSTAVPPITSDFKGVRYVKIRIVPKTYVEEVDA